MALETICHYTGRLFRTLSDRIAFMTNPLHLIMLPTLPFSLVTYLAAPTASDPTKAC